MTPTLTTAMNTVGDRLNDLRAERDRLEMVIRNNVDPKVVAETIVVWRRYAARVDEMQADWNTQWLRQCETAAKLTAAGVTEADVAGGKY